jgi:predicted AlkP superfamily phosphohydrolase/phosphomutase
VIDLERTRAFSSFGHLPGVFVNLRGRYEHGIVEPGENYEKLRDDLIGDLAALRDPATDAPVFGRVARREEMFSGPAVDRMPDVICETDDPAIRLRGNLGLRTPFVPFRKRKSYHAPNGIFLVKGPGILQGRRIDGTGIEDMAPLVLRLMGLPRLACMDGTVPGGVLDPDFFGDAEQPVVSGDDIAFEKRTGDLSAADRDAIERDLEVLGYL